MFRARGVFVFWLILLLTGVVTSWSGEDLRGIACRSVHLAYQAPPGTAFYNEVTAENTANGTYFSVCGWNHGYFGMQQLGTGEKIVIFSVWDSAAGDDPAVVPEDKQVQPSDIGAGVQVTRFGNEGTGGKSIFKYDWKVGACYRFLVTSRADVAAGRTVYDGYFYLPEEKRWKHLVTFSKLTVKDERLRGYYAFVEDFLRNKVSATQVRSARYGNGWVKTKDGWSSLRQATFTADDNTAVNIDAGAVGPLFFLATGGETSNTSAKLNEVISLAGAAGQPPTDLPLKD